MKINKIEQASQVKMVGAKLELLEFLAPLINKYALTEIEIQAVIIELLEYSNKNMLRFEWTNK